MYQNGSKHIKVENDCLDHKDNFSQKIPPSFDFSGNARLGSEKSAKPFYICLLCDAELSSEETLYDHLSGRKHMKKVKKRYRDIQSGNFQSMDTVFVFF